MKALIAILATVQPIEALHNLIVFTKPWDFDRFDTTTQTLSYQNEIISQENREFQLQPFAISHV